MCSTTSKKIKISSRINIITRMKLNHLPRKDKIIFISDSKVIMYGQILYNHNISGLYIRCIKQTPENIYQRKTFENIYHNLDFIYNFNRFRIQKYIMTSVSKQPYDFIFKVIIIGDTGVGKTNMILRFSEGSFKENYVATIGVDFKIKTLSVGDKRIRLQLWDTAGQERFRTITETYYKGAAGIVLTYSVDNRRTFQNLCTGMLYVEKWMKQIKEKTPPNIQKLIIGNKSDLEDCREVKFEEGVKMAEQFSEPGNKVEFMEVSAKTGKNVSEGFHKICEQIKQYIENSHFNTTEGKTSVLKLDRHDERKKCAC